MMPSGCGLRGRLPWRFGEGAVQPELEGLLRAPLFPLDHPPGDRPDPGALRGVPASAVVRCPFDGEAGSMTTADQFRALHERPEPLLLPNPWDAGTARLLAVLGFEALATTSLGVANMLGRRRASRQDILDNCREIASATAL